MFSDSKNINYVVNIFACRVFIMEQCCINIAYDCEKKVCLIQEVLINTTLIFWLGICKLKYFLLEPLTYKKYVIHNSIVYHEIALAWYSQITMMIIKMRYDNIQLFPKVNYNKEYADLIFKCTYKYNLFVNFNNIFFSIYLIA